MKDLCRGFSLIEIMIVLVIMSVMLAVAGPRVAKSMRGLTLRSTTKKIAGAMRYARSRAVNTGRIYNVVFDAENNRVVLLQAQKISLGDTVAGAAEPEQPETLEDNAGDSPQVPQQEKKIYTLPEGIRFGTISVGDSESSEQEGDEIYRMAFFPNGTSFGGEIVLTDEKERTYAIEVNFMTGVVSVEEQTDE